MLRTKAQFEYICYFLLRAIYMICLMDKYFGDLKYKEINESRKNDENLIC